MDVVAASVLAEEAVPLRHLFRSVGEVLPLGSPEKSTSENSTSENSEERLLLEAYRLVQQNLQSQVIFALAMDQKSVTFCGLVVASLAALIGFSVGKNLHWSLELSMAFFAVSSACSALAIRPIKFFVPGLPFENFDDDITSKRLFLDVVKEYGRLLDECLEKNEKKMAGNTFLFKLAIVSALVGLFFLIFRAVFLPIIFFVSGYFNSGATQ